MESAEHAYVDEQNARLRAELAAKNVGVEALHAELAARGQALAEAERRQRELLAVLAHELRNPLAAVRLAVEGLVVDDEVALLRRQIARLERLVDDLLDVSRLASGEVAIELRALDLTRLVDRAVSDRCALLRRAGLEISWDPPPMELIVRGDVARLTQVVNSMLDDAAGASVEPVIPVHLEEVEGRVRLTVGDHGAARGGNNGEMISGLFVQTRRPPDRADGGLELGLTLVQQLVQQHAGELWVRDDERGHALAMELPRLVGALEPVGHPPRASRDAEGLRVLIVEDGDDLRELLALRLRRRGVLPVTAADGPEALAKLESAELEGADFDAVLADLGLPGMTGYELARRIRARKPALRLIALTGYGASEDRARAAEAGFDQHLTKPIAVDELIEALLSG